MALFLPLVGEHEHNHLPLLGAHHHDLLSSLLGGDHLRLKLSDEDFLSPLLPRKTRRQILSSPYIRHQSYKNRGSVAPSNSKDFQVNIDVQQFSPEEISVKSVNDDTIVVECKHEEKPDDHGYISRHFIRKYKVPKGHDIKKSVSKLSSDGVLTVTAPKVEKNERTEVEIPIMFTNQPSRIQNSANEVVEAGEGKAKKQK